MNDTENKNPLETPKDPIQEAVDFQAQADEQRIASAATRMVDVPAREPAPLPVDARPTARASAPEGYKLTGRDALLAGAAGIAIATSIVGIPSLQGGSENGDSRGEAVEGSSTIELNDVANLRNDPKVEEGEWDNSVLKLEAPVTIDVDDDLRRLDNTNNGTWLGIPAEDIEAAIPNADVSGDKDGVIWVNEQGVSSVTPNDEVATETGETPNQ